MRDCCRNNGEKKRLSTSICVMETMNRWTIGRILRYPGMRSQDCFFFFLKITMHVGISVFLP